MKRVLYPLAILVVAVVGVFLLTAAGAAARAARDGAPDAEAATALAYLAEQAPALGLSAADLAEVGVTDQYASDHTGVTHVYLQQSFDGRPIYNARATVNLLRDGRVLHAAFRFEADVADRVNAVEPQLTAVDAVLAAGAAVDRAPTGPLAIQSSLGRETLVDAPGLSRAPVAVALVYQPAPDGALRLAYDLGLHVPGEDHYWQMRVDALDGTILAREDRVIHDSFGAPAEAGALLGRAAVPAGPTTWTTDGLASDRATAVGSYRVYEIPKEYPDDGPRTLVANPDDPLASPFGWHDTNGVAGAEYTITRGNNVYAYADRDGDDLPDPGSAPDGGAGLIFDFGLNLGQEPHTYIPAAVTNLFYWNNITHDILSRYGFDEVAGNFQDNNYGAGGLGGDAVHAQAQDGANVGNRNNANFLTAADGIAPAMQMFLWDLTTPERDGDLSSAIIVHEYVHGVSLRQTGGPATVFCLGNQEQMGEGWSDFYALVLTANATDVGATRRGIGTYALGQPTNGAGIRPAPYSTSFGDNNYTYGDIAGLPAPHGVGFVWATMLWEVYWELVNAHGFNPDIYDPWHTGGNNLALQLVNDGLKLQVCNPGFEDGRDAILAADVALTGGANQCHIWAGFARRGLGWSADQGSSNSKFDGTQAFDLPPTCLPSLNIAPPSINEATAPDLTVTVPLSLTNSGGGDLIWTLSERAALAGGSCNGPFDSPWLSLSPTNGTIGGSGTAVVDVTLDATGLGEAVYNATLCVISNDPGAPEMSIPVQFTVMVPDYGAYLGPDLLQGGLPGTTVTHTVTIENIGLNADTFHLSVSGNGWPTQLIPNSVFLGVGASATFDVVVDIANAALNGQTDVAAVTATAQSDPSFTDTVKVSTRSDPLTVFLPSTYR